jgi:triacylglycerol lipase
MLRIIRVAILAIAAFGVMIAGNAVTAADRPLPIIFVHGNGDTAGLWITTLWRFESNDYPRELLTALDLRYPLARSVDDKPEAGRSSTADVMRQLADEVAAVRQRTGAEKIILVAQSRGGNTVRNYLKNGDGAANVAMAILCGATNHGVIVSDEHLVGSEFNGASAFMRDLNASPDEVVPSVRFMTIRSDNNDKFAQPDGRFLNLPGVATGVGYDAPALKGAVNIVLPALDHRETGYSAQAFTAMFPFIADRPPATLDIAPEAQPLLNGNVSGFENGAPTNIGLADARIEIYKISPDSGERLGKAAHQNTTGTDGVWGPFTAAPDAYYEFVVTAPGYPVTHIYRSPFPRSSDIVNLRPQILAKDDKDSGAVVYLSRPRGYLGIDHHEIEFDDTSPPGITQGVPGTSSVKLSFPAGPQRTVQARFDAERIAARTWPIADGEVSVFELTY